MFLSDGSIGSRMFAVSRFLFAGRQQLFMTTRLPLKTTRLPAKMVGRCCLKQGSLQDDFCAPTLEAVLSFAAAAAGRAVVDKTNR